MKIAHVRERHAPAGAPWRLAAALPVADGVAAPGDGQRPRRWLDLEVARRRAVAADREPRPRPRPPPPAGDDARRPPRPRAAGRGPRRARRGLRARGDERRRRRPRRRRPRVRPADPAAAEPARLLRVRGPRPDDVGAPRRRGARGLVPPADLLLQQRVGDPRPGRAGLGAGGVDASSTTSWRSRRWSTRRPSTCPPERGEEAIGGYTIFNDWSARDLQREETVVRLGPAKGKDFASSIGPWLVTPDELARRARRRARPGRTWR